MTQQSEQPPGDDQSLLRTTELGPDDRDWPKERTDTVSTAHGPDDTNAAADVVSDPAHDDRLGSDWADEGGATSSGPATTTVSEDTAEKESMPGVEGLPQITLDPPD